MTGHAFAGLGAAVLGVVTGLLLPVGAEPGRLAPAGPAATAPSALPGLLTQGQPAEAPTDPSAAPAAPPPREIPPHLEDVGLAPPEREWRVVMQDPALADAERMERLLAVAEKFRHWRQYEWVDRTLALVIERTEPRSALRDRAELARAWNEHRRGRPREALDRVERVAASEHSEAYLRARAAYATVIFAYGVGELDRARRGVALLETHATPKEADLRSDVEMRYAALLRASKTEGDAR